ncbi:MAG: hypothetical protein M1347_04740 [Chloroflexi bacterium]|nr:hypothetical protein [Chloroflexota bacterium]
MSFSEGPYVQAACFCEQVIEDKSGVLSLIRIIDTLTHTAAGPEPPKDLQPFTYNLKLVLMLKAGSARGRFTLQLTPELPTGEARKTVDITVHLDGEEKGQNIITNMAFTFEHEGLHWFIVKFENEILTQIPLRIRYNRVITGAPPGPETK